jgi:hypothetical protein
MDQGLARSQAPASFHFSPYAAACEHAAGQRGRGLRLVKPDKSETVRNPLGQGPWESGLAPGQTKSISRAPRLGLFGDRRVEQQLA